MRPLPAHPSALHHPRPAPVSPPNALISRMKAELGRTNEYSITQGIALTAPALWLTSHENGYRPAASIA